MYGGNGGILPPENPIFQRENTFLADLPPGNRYSSGFRFSIGGGGVYADPAGIFLSENLISQKKNAFLADFAAGLSKIIKQNLSGGCLEGDLSPFDRYCEAAG